MKRKTRKAPFYYYLILAAIPIFIIVLLELGLRIFNYGNDYSSFVTLSDNFSDYYVLNPKLPQKYFGNIQNPPSVIPDAFEKIKRDSTFRVFVFGGSSAAGWPFIPNASFSRVLKRRLEFLYPNNFIEIINCGISAVNSYTIDDILPDALDMEPDLILLYAGHNEFYGALGEASTQKLASSRVMKKFILNLSNYKILQLIKNILAGVLASDSPNDSGTLMSRMIGEKSIPLDSEEYNSCFEEFSANVSEIVELSKSRNIPIIISNLSTNLMQKPLDFLSSNEPTKALSLYGKGIEQTENDSADARQLLISAKDTDELRFRISSKFNNELEKIAEKYQVPFINVDKVFSENSPKKIPGFNLMVDHLHPTIEGQELIAESFFSKMDELHYLPNGSKRELDEKQLNNILSERRPISRLDSLFTNFKLKTLLTSFPFSPKMNASRIVKTSFKDEIEKIAYQAYNGKISWETAHYAAANYFLKIHDLRSYLQEMLVLLEDKPFNTQDFVRTIDILIKLKAYPAALPILKRLNFIHSDEYSVKWLEFITFQLQQFEKSLKYQNEYLKYKPDDAEIYYNIGGTYLRLNKIAESKLALEKCLRLNPSHKKAKQLLNRLQK